MQYPEEYWYEQLLAADSVSRPLTSQEKSIIIKKSMEQARLQKLWMEQEMGMSTAEECLTFLGFRLEEEAEAVQSHFLYFGLLEPGENRVTIHQTAISMTYIYMQELEAAPRVSEETLRRIVLLHELYHAIEERTPGIYTRNVKIPTKWLGLIPCDRVVEAASEIGAIHFSKLMSGIDFSPYIFTQYLLEAANQTLEVEDES